MSPFLMIAAAAAAASANPSTFEALTQAGKDAPLCTADGDLCVSGTRDGAFTVARKDKTVAQWTAAKSEDDDRFRPLPTLLRLKGGGLLVGVGVQRTQMYSGGNAEVIFQRIMLVRPGKPAVTVFEAPYSSEISIRACFDEKDAKQRLDACSDEYTLQSDLKVEPGEQSGLPNLSLSVLSNRFPRGVSRNADSLAMPALTQDDLIDETDAACTYRRTLAFDAAAGAYKPSAPLPACSEYTVP